MVLERIDAQDKQGRQQEVRTEIFRRGRKTINGIPLEVLLRNPAVRAEYDAAVGSTEGKA